jgi:hypothetical protein
MLEPGAHPLQELLVHRPAPGGHHLADDSAHF